MKIMKRVMSILSVSMLFFSAGAVLHCTRPNNMQANDGNAASGSQTLKKLGQWGSASFTDIVVNGRYAYCAAGYAGLEIIDISDRTHPVRVAGIETSSPANSICFNNGFIYVSVNPDYLYAYVLHGDSFLEIIDVHNPLNPIRRGKIAVGAGEGSIAVQRDHVYLNERKDNESGLAIFNVSNPDNPVQVGFVSGYFREFCVRNNYVYTVWNKGLAVINVSNPSAPFLVSSRSYGAGTIVGGAIELKGNHVFLEGDFWYEWGGSVDYFEKNWFGIIDISDPAAPRVEWERSLGRAYGTRNSLCIVGDDIFIGGPRLEVMDISNIANPVMINSMDISKNTANEMFCDNDYLFTATDKGLVIYAIADPRNLTVSGVYKECGDAFSVWAFDRKVCLGRGEIGLGLIDVSDSSAPKLEWSYFEDGFSVYWGMIKEGYGHLRGYDTWKIIDFSNPLHPFSIWTYPRRNIVDDVRRLVIQDRFAYVMIYSWLTEGRLEIYDIADPFHPILSASDDALGDIRYFSRIAVQDDIICCSSFSYDTMIDKLQIFKFSNNRKLIRMGSLQLSKHEIDDIAIRYPYVYSVGYDKGESVNKFQVFSISDPAQPSLLGSYPFGPKNSDVYAGNLYVRRYCVYVAGGLSGLLAIDVNDPNHPKEVASFKTPYMCNWVHGFGNRIYATDGGAGRMYILEALDASSVSIGLSVMRKSDRAWAFHPNYADLKISIWNEDNLPVSSYIISRVEEKGTYAVVKEVPAADMVSNPYQYRDFGLVNKRKYTYKVEALDAQGKVIAVSEEVTI